MWARLGVRNVHAEIDGDIQHARPFREIHPQEKNVAPAAVRQVHAHRRALAQDWERAVGAGLEQLAAQAQRLIGRMAHAEHPLVAAHGTDATADLIS